MGYRVTDLEINPASSRCRGVQLVSLPIPELHFNESINDSGELLKFGMLKREVYLRAATIYTSRSFPSKLVLGEPVVGSDAESFPVLIPLVDILNHKPNTKIIWDPEPDSFSLKSTETLPIGTPVFNNYGPKANEELLMGYGFVIPDNPVDSLAMKFTLVPRGLAADIWERRAAKQKWAPVFYLSKSIVSKRHEGVEYNNLENDWPDALVDLFRILVANEYELQLLQDTDPSQKPVSTRNELAVAIGLRAAINQKLMMLQKHDMSATTPPTNERERSVDIYRRGQEDIIVSKVEKLNGFIQTYALNRRLGSEHYLAQHSALGSYLEQHPIPLEEYHDEDVEGPQEIIKKGELVLLVGLLREYLVRNSGSDNTSDDTGFWNRFVSLIIETQGLTFAEFQDDGDDGEMDVQQLYESLVSYCNAIPGFFNEPVTRAHISWAWGIVGMKCVEISEGDIVLTI
ncbi:hypothetical protein ABW21_db0208700 [Orbilia brochopaga]|nr:hypothetical protein ABW21_db0208700 [Drechslerella brochopaga]